MIQIKNEAMDPVLLLWDSTFLRNSAFCVSFSGASFWTGKNKVDNLLAHLFDSMVHYLDREVENPTH
jgi:hypothetical protein